MSKGFFQLGDYVTQMDRMSLADLRPLLVGMATGAICHYFENAPELPLFKASFEYNKPYSVQDEITGAWFHGFISSWKATFIVER